MKQYPSACVGTLIFNPEGEVLLVKSPKWHTEYNIPGGHIELGETIEQTVKREVKEELRVEITIGNLIGYFPDQYGPSGVPTLNIAYFVSIKSGQVKPASDVVQAKWFDLDNLPSKLAFQNTKDALQKTRELYFSKTKLKKT